MIKAILFDLDGTLLPMDDESFTNDYFSSLVKKVSPLGYDSEKLVYGVWSGTKSMIQNDGTNLNEHVFWSEFTKIMGDEILNHKHLFDEYYEKEFQLLSKSCGYNSKSKEVVDKVKDMGYRVVLATNPVFPEAATVSRIKWAGLTPEDFELYTTYENIGYCKLNPKYYEDILMKIGCKPEECLMVGNNAKEDMIAQTIGMNVFLLTDYLVNKEEKDISQYPSGSYEELLEYIDHLSK